MGQGGTVFRNMYKGHMDKTNGGEIRGGGGDGWKGVGNGDNCT